METDALIFKIADEEWEFNEVHKLNYNTFVSEIPQHETNEEGILKDKFDAENDYIICLSGQNLIGMLAIRSNRPFSLDQKLPDLEKHLPPHTKLCEVRLLSVKKEFRNTAVFKGLITRSREYCRQRNIDLAVISGFSERVRLYKGLGFIPFGPLVGSDEVKFQPMYLNETQYNKTPISKAQLKSTSEIFDFTDDANINFLPGPVKISASVRKALSKSPMSHRSPEFQELFDDTRKRICNLVKTKNIEIINGSGTLANDIVAGQLLQLPGRGMILSNGEFGERLIKNAKGFALDFDTYSLEWGKPYDLSLIESCLNTGNYEWLWMTHCETSTGMLNNVEAVGGICEKYIVKQNIDCISSVATNHLDLSKVYMATITSGKGLASFAGLSMVCYNHQLEPATKPIPRYFDLHYYTQCNGIPFTLPTNLVYALHQAIVDLKIDERVKHIENLIATLREELNKLDFGLLLPPSLSANAVVTIPLPEGIKSQEVGFELQKTGILISFNSQYLIERNWIQLCLMGNISIKMIMALMPVFKKFSPKYASEKA